MSLSELLDLLISCKFSSKHVALNEFIIICADNLFAALDIRAFIAGLIAFDIIIATALNNLLNLRSRYSELVLEIISICDGDNKSIIIDETQSLPLNKHNTILGKV